MADNQDGRLFHKILSDWTEAFNRRDLARACHLFSPVVVANYQGVPAKNYTTICDGFKTIFANTARRYQYHFKIHQVYRANGLAAVRLTWYLQVNGHGRVVLDSTDEGLDVFEKNKQGEWQIVNYLAYPISFPSK